MMRENLAGEEGRMPAISELRAAPARRERDSDFGRLVRDTLHTTGSRQVDLALAAGVSQTSISDWLRGIKRPSAENISALAQALAKIEARILPGEARTPSPERVRTLRDRMLQAVGYTDSPIVGDVPRDYVLNHPRVAALLTDLGHFSGEELEGVLAALEAVTRLALTLKQRRPAAPAHA
jgi:transcriptional regulator with XRE-family HTH domain